MGEREAPAQFSEESDTEGRFVRQQSAFRQLVTADGASGFPAESGRYHLYVSLACPWAHRSIIVRHLKGLEQSISLSLVDPVRDKRGWRFNAAFPDPLHQWDYLSQAYRATDRSWRGRITVPVLWDRRTERIVSNESSEIIVMLNNEFNAFAQHAELDLYPEHLRSDIDALNDRIYTTVNDGVYKAGFATSQQAYEEAVYPLFETLGYLDELLGSSRFLLGPRQTLADWRLFTTLVRFDAVYYLHFKCNVRQVADYRNLYPYLRDLYQTPGVAQTVDFDHIKRHYYLTHDRIDPTGIIPVGPAQDLDAAHNRAEI